MKNAILIFATIVFIVSACKDPFWLEDNKKTDHKDRTLEYLVIYNSNHIYANDFNERKTLIAKSQEELDKFLAKMTPSVTPLPEIKNVDFENKMVLGIAMPPQSSGSNRLKITSVKMVDGTIEVRSQITIPNIGTDDIGYPMYLIELDKHSEPIKFLETEIIREGDMDLSILFNKHWELSIIIDDNGNIIDPNNYKDELTNNKVVDLYPFTIQFKDDYTFSGYSNCNNYGGSYSINGSELSIQQLWSTEAACSLSDFYQTLLRNAVSIDYSAQKYIIITSVYQGMTYQLNYFHFIPENENELDETQWIFESYSTDGGITFNDSYVNEDGENVNFMEDIYTLNFYYMLVSGKANCSEFGIEYYLSGENGIDILTFWMELTCGFNQEYFNLLIQSKSYDIYYGGIDRLRLYSKDKKNVMVFQYNYLDKENVLGKNQKYILDKIGYVNMENNRIEKLISVDDKNITFSTTKDYKYSGNGICNEYNGNFYNYNNTYGAMTVDFGSTKVFCGDEFEQKYFNTISNVTTYREEGGRLKLFSYKDLEYNYLVFKPIE